MFSRTQRTAFIYEEEKERKRDRKGDIINNDRKMPVFFLDEFISILTFCIYIKY